MKSDEDATTTTELAIEGMTCASCVLRTEKALAAVPGVHEATVNLATGRARVRHGGEASVPGRLEAAVAHAGYAAHRIELSNDPTLADERTLDELEGNGQVAFRYCGPTGEVGNGYNPNGSARNIAGIFNRTKNVLGMMPHPENAIESLQGSTDGKALFQSMVEALS